MSIKDIAMAATKFAGGPALWWIVGIAGVSLAGNAALARMLWSNSVAHAAQEQSARTVNDANVLVAETLQKRLLECVDDKAQLESDAKTIKSERDKNQKTLDRMYATARATRQKAISDDEACRAWARSPVCPYGLRN